MDHLLLDLEIDAARIFAMGGPAQAQPVVIYLDATPDEPQRDEDPDQWDELTAKLAAAAPALAAETTLELTERTLTRMEG